MLSGHLWGSGPSCAWSGGTIARSSTRARRIRNQEITPPEELQIVLQHFAETERRDFHGIILAPMRLEGWRPEFPTQLFEMEDVAVATTILYFKPAGTAWGQRVVLLAYTKLDGAPR